MKKQDFIVIAAVLLIAAAILAALHFGGKTGAAVQIQINNEITQTLPLGKDTVQVIETPDGVNTLVIQDGCAAVTEADCPDKICVRHRKISKTGESIICLPHKLVITVIGSTDENEIDI